MIKEGKRCRYIGFIITSANLKITKLKMIEEIQKQCKLIFCKNCKKMGIRLIKFNGSAGIICCNHIEKENIIKLLKSINNLNLKKIKIDTIATSGTIKSLLNKHMKKYFID